MQDWDQYGIDWDGDIPDEDSVDLVEVPEINYAISVQKYESLCQNIDPLQNENSYGIETYIRALQFITEN